MAKKLPEPDFVRAKHLSKLIPDNNTCANILNNINASPNDLLAVFKTYSEVRLGGYWRYEPSWSAHKLNLISEQKITTKFEELLETSQFRNSGDVKNFIYILLTAIENGELNY